MASTRVFLALLLALGFTGAWAAPRIQHWQLDNGVRVYFVETHELPMVQIKWVFDAGSARDPAGRHGLAALTARMLQEGAGKRDADEVAAAFEDLGAEFGASADRDMAGVSLRSLADKAYLDPAVQVLREVVMAPTFPPASLERERQRALVALKEDAASPGRVVEKAFMKALYGDHPYATDPLGEAASLKAIRRQEITAHHARYYVGRNAVLAMVGDLSPRRARRLARRLAGDLPAGRPAPELPPVPDLAESRSRHIPFPSRQTHVRMGEPGMHRLDPDYFPLYVGNYVLGGGGLVSRLSEEVREQRGLSYSVYSYFLPMKQRGPFIVGLQTKNAQREQALKVVRRTLAGFIARGPTAKELKAAKSNLTGGFPLRIDSNRKIAAYLTVIGFYRLPLSYLQDFPGRVEAVTVEQVRDAFRRRVHPDRMVTVTVGGRD